MQGKLIIKKADKKKLLSAAHFSGVKVVEGIDVGDESHLEVKAAGLQDAFNCGIRFI